MFLWQLIIICDVLSRQPHGKKYIIIHHAMILFDTLFNRYKTNISNVMSHIYRI